MFEALDQIENFLAVASDEFGQAHLDLVIGGADVNGYGIAQCILAHARAATVTPVNHHDQASS